MARRRISMLSPRGEDEWSPGDVAGSIDQLAELTAAQRKRISYAVRSVPMVLTAPDFEELERIRLKFFRSTTRRLNAIGFDRALRRARALHKSTAAFRAALERDESCDELLLGWVAGRMGVRPGLMLAWLPQLAAMEEATAVLLKTHQRAILDVDTPFEGLIAELVVWWRARGLDGPRLSNRVPPSSRKAPAWPFAMLVHALMVTLPEANRMHVAGVDANDRDSWGALTQAILRAIAATRDYLGGPLGLRIAWSLGRR